MPLTEIATSVRKTFDVDRNGTGTAEWAGKNENTHRGCSNDCLYCYAAYSADVRFRLRPRKEWSREEPTKRADIKSYAKRDDVIMYPTAHDITPGTIDVYLRVAKLILGAGNELLVVSKPRLDCIRRLTEELAGFKPQIMLRFTIGTTDRDAAKFWEPGAPPPAERIEALRHAFEAGYRTSVSAEPLLGGPETASQVLTAVRPYVTDTVWIGKMNRPRSRVGMTDPVIAAAVLEIERLQSDAAVLEMHAQLDSDPMVRWKDSIKKVLSKASGEKVGKNSGGNDA